MAGFQCSGCREFQLFWEPRCRACGREGYLCGSHKFDRVSWQEITTLAHNLAVAAGLCRAFDLGVESCFTYCEHWYGSDGWKPGCGCEAPR